MAIKFTPFAYSPPLLARLSPKPIVPYEYMTRGSVFHQIVHL